MIERNDSQQTTCNMVLTLDGEKQQVATASCTIRPDRGLHLNIDMNVAREKLDTATLTEISQAFGAYVIEELRKAASLGVPVNV